jgi:hypothetical protein
VAACLVAEPDVGAAGWVAADLPPSVTADSAGFSQAVRTTRHDTINIAVSAFFMDIALPIIP